MVGPEKTIPFSFIFGEEMTTEYKSGGRVIRMCDGEHLVVRDGLVYCKTIGECENWSGCVSFSDMTYHRCRIEKQLLNGRVKSE